MCRDCSYVDDQSCCNEILVIKKDYVRRSGVILRFFRVVHQVVWTLTNAIPSMISFYRSDIWSMFNLPVKSEAVKLPSTNVPLIGPVTPSWTPLLSWTRSTYHPPLEAATSTSVTL
jgi:hypothetical protein